jgi:hypothetical protein
VTSETKAVLPFGAVLGDAWALYRRLLGRTLVVATAVFLVLRLVEVAALTRDGTATRLGLLALSFALSVVGTQLVQGALAEAVADLREGREPGSAGDLYARTRPRIGALGAAAAITTVTGLVASLFLLVPGLIVFTRWSLAVPVIVFERTSAGAALRRSNRLVRGRTWQVLRLTLAVFAAAAVVGALLNVALSGLPPFWAAWIGGTAAGALTMPFIAHALTVVYFRLAQPETPLPVGSAPLGDERRRPALPHAAR